MNDQSRSFLEELIKTPSPSGDEVQLQRKWKDYVSQYADVVETDYAGNVIASINPDSQFKVMLAGHCDEIAFMVTYIDDEGYLYVSKAGGISPKVALGMRLNVLGKNGTIKGVVGIKAEHHGGAKKEIKIEDIFIDCGFKDKEEALKNIRVGNYAIYNYDYEYLANDGFVGRGLDNRTGAFIVAEVMRRLSEDRPNVGVYSVSTVNEETTMGGAFFAASKISPTFGLACDVTFATDYPGIDNKKYGDVKLGKGPVVSFGSQINNKINELIINVAEENKIEYQIETTPQTTGTDADKIRFSGDGVPVALVSLPLRYMHSPSEHINLKDIENEIELLVKVLQSLKGDECFKPL